MSINSLVSNIQNQMVQQGMTFNPNIDLRNDLINHYGWDPAKVASLSESELYSIMDRYESGNEDEFERIPPQAQLSTCNHCKSPNIQLVHVDCETRGDCEIYIYECEDCPKESSVAYAEEWYEDFEEVMQEEVQVESTPITPKYSPDTQLDNKMLSIRACMVLSRNGIHTVGQVMSLSYWEVAKLRNVSKTTIEELEEVFQFRFTR
ncbi:DNA-directed RNA polymerase subunit alpha [Bacillus phage vB_BceM-HSE3]|nr:DNA-directed RNA polymerase subunit alpha [Bacillus phage vB_BceM-HSE3]